MAWIWQASSLLTDSHSPTENAAQQLGAKDRQSLALLVATARDRELRLAHIHLLVDLPQTYRDSHSEFRGRSRRDFALQHAWSRPGDEATILVGKPESTMNILDQKAHTKIQCQAEVQIGRGSAAGRSTRILAQSRVSGPGTYWR